MAEMEASKIKPADAVGTVLQTLGTIASLGRSQAFSAPAEPAFAPRPTAYSAPATPAPAAPPAAPAGGMAGRESGRLSRAAGSEVPRYKSFAGDDGSGPFKVLD